jgi:hypothetical protein
MFTGKPELEELRLNSDKLKANHFLSNKLRKEESLVSTMKTQSHHSTGGMSPTEEITSEWLETTR